MRNLQINLDNSIITRQRGIEYLNRVAVVEISTKRKAYPTDVYIDQKGNLPIPSSVQADNVHTLPRNRLMKYVRTLDAAVINEISVKVILALSLEDAAGSINR